jgi:hypothetical protein
MCVVLAGTTKRIYAYATAVASGSIRVSGSKTLTSEVAYALQSFL